MIRCPAKINLFLKLVGKRADGYHDLESLFGFLDIYDELRIELLDQNNAQINVKADGEFGGFVDINDNLFIKIWQFFCKNYPISQDISVKITKNIPVGAGLGGGSSDAAFFMMQLNKIFELELKKEELQDISLNFGSDIAFFFENNASIVKGRGEKIENFSNFNDIPVLLVNPGIFLSTKAVFDEFDGNFSDKISNEEIQQRDIMNLIQHLKNDTTKAAIELAPVVAEVLEEMQNNQAQIAKMSGTGSTCFAIFDNLQQLQVAKDAISQKFPNFWIKQTKILADYGS